MDAFARLGLEKRLALSAEELREAFRQAGKSEHPDAGGGDFEAVQAAYGLLASPARRLKLWLELAGVAGDERGALGPDLMDHFGRVGGVLQQADGLIRRREAALSALAKALLEHETQQLRELLEEAQAQLEDSVAGRIGSFPALERGEGDPWRTMRELAFLEKWQVQLRERYARLWG